MRQGPRKQAYVDPHTKEMKPSLKSKEDEIVLPLVNGDPINIDELIDDLKYLLLEIIRENKSLRKIVT